MNSSTSWWSHFFTGLGAELVGRLSNPKQTSLEADFIQSRLGLKKGAILGDIPCGNGRLSIELAKRDIRMRGLDISSELLLALQAAAAETGVKIKTEHGDMQELQWQSELDGAFCFGNSFAYFDRPGNRRFLAGIYRALRPGAKFLLQTNLIAESILTKPLARTWYELGDILFLHSTRYEPGTGRLISDYHFMREGLLEKKTANYQIYSVRDLLEMFRELGFEDLNLMSSTNGDPFKLSDPNLYMEARKPPER